MLIEQSRLVLQRSLDDLRTALERNKLGQFATPTALADDVLRTARQLMGDQPEVMFLDPAIGTGSFYSAAIRAFGKDKLARSVGFEIDPHYGDAAREHWSEYPLQIVLEDFTRAQPPNEAEKFNLVVCNPPYVRHHHLDSCGKKSLIKKAAEITGLTSSGLSGLYCYFLLIAHAWMKQGSLGCWLIPSEFMDVNYGSALKDYLTESVELVRIHRFDPSELQFGDALVSSAVVFFRKRFPRSGHRVEFTFGGTLASPKVSRTIEHSKLHGADKWSGLAEDGIQDFYGGAVLSDYFFVKRGIATGDNGFFVLSEAKARSLAIPPDFLKPILPSPRYLETDFVRSDSKGVPEIERRQFVIDCPLPEVDVQERYPQLWSYLQTGLDDTANSYICGNRSPWYSQENREPSAFLCTYMGRNLGNKREKPFRFILNRSAAIATNVYLHLYPKPPLQRALDGEPNLDFVVWEYLCSIPAERLLQQGRVYGGGLYKLEPKELGRVPADQLAAILPASSGPPALQGDLFRVQVA